MSLEKSEQQIINIAITIFQNVGIKRWIDKIQVLMEQQIYFQICKIIFPDSQNMIEIFKISQSGLSVGKKIQKIIQMISRIIRLDLYHISGQQIAQGNLMHLVNWLQLLQALSNNCLQNGRQSGVKTQNHDPQAINYTNQYFYTVLGIENQFSHRYSKESETERQSQKTQQYLLPVQNKDEKKQKKKKKVKFQQKQSMHSTLSTMRGTKHQYPKKLDVPKEIKFLNKKKNYINKMNFIKQQITKKQINDQNYSFQQWTHEKNRNAIKTNKKIQTQDKERKQFIKKHIGKRQQIVDSLIGQKQAINTMKKMFKQQKIAQKKMNNFYRKQYEQQALDLMDLNFASDFYSELQQFLAVQ